MQIPARWVHDKLRIPMPEGDERVLARPATQGVALKRATHVTGCQCDGCMSMAALKADAAPVNGDGSDGLDAAIAEEMADWRTIMQGMTDPIQTAIDEALKNGLTAEELLAKLPDLMGKVPADELQERLTRAAFAARLLALAGVQIADKG